MFLEELGKLSKISSDKFLEGIEDAGSLEELLNIVRENLEGASARRTDMLINVVFFL